MKNTDFKISINIILKIFGLIIFISALYNLNLLIDLQFVASLCLGIALTLDSEKQLCNLKLMDKLSEKNSKIVKNVKYILMAISLLLSVFCVVNALSLDFLDEIILIKGFSTGVFIIISPLFIYGLKNNQLNNKILSLFKRK